MFHVKHWGKYFLFIKCNRHVPGKNCAIRAAVMSFHYRLMLFVSDGQIYLSVMVFLAKFYLTCCFWHSWIVSRETIQQEDKKDYDRRKPYFGFRNAELCFICGVAIGLFMLNWLFYSWQHSFCRFLFHVKQNRLYAHYAAGTGWIDETVSCVRQSGHEAAGVI